MYTKIQREEKEQSSWQIRNEKLISFKAYGFSPWRMNSFFVSKCYFFPFFLPTLSSTLPEDLIRSLEEGRVPVLHPRCRADLLSTVGVPSLCSRVRLLAALWTVAHQAPLCTQFPRQGHWVAMPFSRGPAGRGDRTCGLHVSCTGRWVLERWCHLGSHWPQRAIWIN